MTPDVFPVIYSTLAPQALVRQVICQYQLETVSQCLLWYRGLSDVYLVQTIAAQYILRVSHHHWRSSADIQFELELLDFLHQNYLPVAYPLKTKEGKLFVTIHALEGDRYAALFPYAPGTIPLGDLNVTQSQILGETLAKIHQTASNFQPAITRQPLTLEYLLTDSFKIIAPLLKHRKEDLIYLENEIAKIQTQLQDFSEEFPLWVVCWGDPHSGNVHFTENNQVTLFDFDQCGYGWRAFDLAKFLQVSLSAGISRQVRDAFLSGYQSVQTLSEYELNSLQAFTQTAQIWVWAIGIQAAPIHSWCRLDDSYINKRLQLFKRLTSKDWQLF
jgi:Ser/Thr protein kinase RdoA (MazF antagonist)